MQWILDVSYLVIAAGWKWMVAGTALVAVLVGSLFAAGVFAGNGGAAIVTEVVEPTPAPTTSVTPIPSPQLTLVATPAPTLTLVPVPTPTTEAALDPQPTPTAVPTPTATPKPTLPLPRDVRVPVNLAGAKHVGSLEFVLLYDSAVLELVKVQVGPLAGNALIEYRGQSPGRLWAAMVNLSGMTGDGAVALITFDIVGNRSSDSPLTLESVSAHHAGTLLDMLVEPTPGRFAVSDHALVAPTLGFLP